MQQRSSPGTQNQRQRQFSRGNNSADYQQRKRGSSPSRYQDRNTKPKAVAFQVQTMATSQPQQEYEDDLISRRLCVNTVTSTSNDVVYDDDSDDEEFVVYMMSTAVSSAVSNRIAEARMVLQDSGANICVTPFAILEALPHLQLFKWTKPKRVTFGNGTSAISIYFVLLGPILNKTAVLSCVTNTILAVQPVNKRGYNINFTYQQRCIVTLRDEPQPIINEPVHPSRNLYYVDIQKFVDYVPAVSENM